MHESESSSSHSVLESKSSHESLNLAHESDSSPSPGFEYYNTGCTSSKKELSAVLLPPSYYRPVKLISEVTNVTIASVSSSL